jgi:hypothetical protein
MNVFPTLSTVFRFPKTVSDYLVARFPGLIDRLVRNEHVSPSSFDGIAIAKQSSDVAEALLGMNNPQAIAAWCKSRDKRQGTCDQVLYSWYLPNDLQKDFASKALSSETAREVLESKWFSDSAKLTAAHRADPHQVWIWLESGAEGLTDDEWLMAFNLASKAVSRENPISCYASLMLRPHLAATLIAEGTATSAALAASMVPWIDPAVALERLAAETDPSTLRLGLLPLLDHPSLSTEFRVQGFALAESKGMLSDVYRLGCPSPDSPLDLGVPLGSLTNPHLVELVVSRSMLHAHRVAQFAQACTSLAAPASVVYRMHDLPHRTTAASPGFALPLQALAKRHMLAQVCERATHSNAVVNILEERRRAQKLAAELKEPHQHSPGRRQYRTYWYGSGDVAPATAEELLNTPLDELVAKVVGYRVDPNTSVIFSDLVIAKLGDASDEDSQKRWETFLQLLEKTKGSIKFGTVLSTATKLR